MTIKKDTELAEKIFIFTEIAKCGKIKSAAQRNGIKESNLSRSLKETEEHFHCKLFNRTHGGVQLTEKGRAFYNIACALEDSLHQIKTFANNICDISGDINVWSSEGVGTDFFSIYLEDFYKEYPKVHLNIHCSLESPNHINDIDLGIVYQKPVFSDAAVISHGNIVFKPYASADYVKKYGVPENLDDLIHNHSICTRDNFRLWPEWNNIISNAANLKATTNSSSMLLCMVKQGIGISLLPTFIAAKDNDLIPLPKLNLTVRHPLWIISHKDSKDIPKVRCLINYMIEASKNL